MDMAWGDINQISELYAGRYELLHEHLFLCCSARAGEGIRSEQELKIVIETWQQTRYPIRGKPPYRED